MSAAVIVGEISAMLWASRVGKPSTPTRRPWPCGLRASASPRDSVSVMFLAPRWLCHQGPTTSSAGRGWGRVSASERLVFEQEVLVERAELARGVPDRHLEHPQVGVGPDVGVSERAVVVGLVREVAQAVAGEVEVELPAELLGALDGVVVERRSGQAGGEPLLAHLVPQGPYVAGGLVVLGVVTEDEGLAGVTLGVAVDRAGSE